MVTVPKRMRGSGRIAFLAQRNEIAAELEAGWPVKASYLARADRLAISYQQFNRYVNAFIPADQRFIPPTQPVRADAGGGPLPSPVSEPAPPQPTLQNIEDLPVHARHKPRPRTFVYDGNPREDDKTRLIGPGRRTHED